MPHDKLVYLVGDDSPIYWPDTFSFANYSLCECEQLDPQLQSLGWTKVGGWYTAEGDSFGPLSRACRYRTDKGEEVRVWYG